MAAFRFHFAATVCFTIHADSEEQGRLEAMEYLELLDVKLFHLVKTW